MENAINTNLNLSLYKTQDKNRPTQPSINVTEQISNIPQSKIDNTNLLNKKNAKNDTRPAMTSLSLSPSQAIQKNNDASFARSTNEPSKVQNKSYLEGFKDYVKNVKNASINLLSSTYDTLKMFKSPLILNLALQFIENSSLYTTEYIFKTSREFFTPIIICLLITKIAWHIGKIIVKQEPKKEISEIMRDCFHSGLYLFLSSEQGQEIFKNLLVKGHHTLMSAIQTSSVQNVAPTSLSTISSLVDTTKSLFTKAGTFLFKISGKIVNISYEKLINSIYSKISKSLTISYLCNLLKKETKEAIKFIFNALVHGKTCSSEKLNSNITKTTSKEPKTSSTDSQQVSQTTDISQPSENKNQLKIEILENPKAEPLSPKSIIVQDLVQNTDVSTQEGSSKDLIETSNTIPTLS